MLRHLATAGFALGICVVAGLVMAMSAKPTLIQEKAQDFTLPDLAGRQHRLNDFHGKLILLHFWASWCKPCVKEMPEINTAYRALHDRGFTVIAVNVGEKEEAVRAFVAPRRFLFPILLDKNWVVATRYQVIGLPVSFFIGANGVILDQVQGGSLTIKEIEARLQAIDEV